MGRRVAAGGAGLAFLALASLGTTQNNTGDYREYGMDSVQDQLGTNFEEDRLYCACKCAMHLIGLVYVPFKTVKHFQDDISSLKGKGDDLSAFFLAMFAGAATVVLAFGWMLQVVNTITHWCARTFAPFTESKSFYTLYYGYPPEEPGEGRDEEHGQAQVQEHGQAEVPEHGGPHGHERGQAHVQEHGQAHGHEHGQAHAPQGGQRAKHEFFKPTISLGTVLTSSLMGFLMPLFVVLNMFWSLEDIHNYNPKQDPWWKQYMSIADFNFSLLLLASKFKSFLVAGRIIHQVWPLLVSMLLNFYCVELCCGLDFDKDDIAAKKMWTCLLPLYKGPGFGQPEGEGPCPSHPFCTCVGCVNIYDYTACNSVEGVRKTFLPLQWQME